MNWNHATPELIEQSFILLGVLSFLCWAWAITEMKSALRREKKNNGKYSN